MWVRWGSLALACILMGGSPAAVAQAQAQTSASPGQGPSATGSGLSQARPRASHPAGSELRADRAATGMAPGVTQALRDVKLSMTVQGRIDNLLVREGQRVARGQELLRLDRALEELEVQRRRLLLADTARLVELRSKEKTLTEQVDALRPLLQTGGIARKQFEDEELALSNVIAERKAMEMAKQREKVELDLAVETYERRHLRAPISGVVTKILLREGESVAPNEPVMHLVDTSRVRFLGTVASTLGVQLKPGRTVTIMLGMDDRAPTRQARLVFVSPVTDAASGLVEVIAEFENADGSVKPGISGRMIF